MYNGSKEVFLTLNEIVAALQINLINQSDNENCFYLDDHWFNLARAKFEKTGSRILPIIKCYASVKYFSKTLLARRNVSELNYFAEG